MPYLPIHPKKVLGAATDMTTAEFIAKNRNQNLLYKRPEWSYSEEEWETGWTKEELNDMFWAALEYDPWYLNNIE